LAARPYRAHLKDLMERQVYPAPPAGGAAPEPPYDVAGWTLPLQMGVRALDVSEPVTAESEALDPIPPVRGTIEGPGQAAFYSIRNQANDDFLVGNALRAAGVEVRAVVQRDPPRTKPPLPPVGTLTFPADARARGVLEKVLPNVSTRVIVHPVEPVDMEIDKPGPLSLKESSEPLRPKRLGIYQPWVPSMDEGWTRLVLERFGFAYTTLHNAEVRAGDLGSRIDTLLIPSIDTPTLRNGYGVDETEPTYVGGLGSDGAAAVRAFVEDGGTLVCLEDASQYAIEELGLPVTNVLKGLSAKEFFGPGSIVRVVAEPHQRLTWGVPAECSAYFDRSLAFDVPRSGSGDVRVVLRYATTHPLESGWLLGPEKIQGKAALVEVRRGRGRVILFGFPPQHRGQTHATFRLLFNALL
jgi:hypothetical protein